MIFNQFEEFGNYLWHYEVTGHAIAEVLEKTLRPGETLRGSVFTTGSAGTIAAGDRLKELFPQSKIAASEALQCPTLLSNGFGAHRIEGIGDKHVPWIHNVKNTDVVVAVDDEAPMQLIRLFNEPEGRKYLVEGCARSARGPAGPDRHLRHGNLARPSRWPSTTSGAKDVVFTILTDSMELYGSPPDRADRRATARSPPATPPWPSIGASWA